MGIKPDNRSEFFSRYSRISRFFSAGKEVPSGSVGRAGDVEREHPFDPHPLDVEQVLLVLAEFRRRHAVIVHVPDPQLHQLVARRQTVRGGIQARIRGGREDSLEAS